MRHTERKMAEVNATLSIKTLNINGLDNYKLEKYFGRIDTDRLKVKDRNMYYADTMGKKTGVTALKETSRKTVAEVKRDIL